MVPPLSPSHPIRKRNRSKEKKKKKVLGVRCKDWETGGVAWDTKSMIFHATKTEIKTKNIILIFWILCFSFFTLHNCVFGGETLIYLLAYQYQHPTSYCNIRCIENWKKKRRRKKLPLIIFIGMRCVYISFINLHKYFNILSEY